MLDDASTAAVVERVLEGRPVQEHDGWSLTEGVIQAGASAWQVPALATEVNHEWDREPPAGDCAAVRRHLQASLAPTH
jgi:hypothetical protein